jgi:diaminohydroxyphosphoribosylaminopyrimidine deaminase/5-amino-6-(5-phosphoribosylamino)uracil reductase
MINQGKRGKTRLLNNNVLHDKYLSKALKLAAKGMGMVNPNPMVGALVVKAGKIVGSGYHECYGGKHAEVIALEMAGGEAKGADLYVTLEPCSHKGKTGPCADRIISAGIRRVIIPGVDPNPKVRGKGIKRLREKGVEVISGFCAGDARSLNEPFFHFMEKGIPYVSLKMAISVDGFLADQDGRSKWITSSISRRHAHRIRARHDAILVGTHTLLLDNPSLNVRLRGNYRQPRKVVIDPRCEVTREMKVFNEGREDVVIFRTNVGENAVRRGDTLSMEHPVEAIEVKDESIPVKFILDTLGKRGITSVLVEGGAGTFARFIESGFVNKLFIFVGGTFLGKGLSPLGQVEGLSLEKPLPLTVKRVKKIGDDLLMEAVTRVEEH